MLAALVSVNFRYVRGWQFQIEGGGDDGGGVIYQGCQTADHSSSHTTAYFKDILVMFPICDRADQNRYFNPKPRCFPKPKKVFLVPKPNQSISTMY